MSINKDGIMVVLSSPSGAGKTTLAKLISKEKNFNISISISHTTRKPRINEVHGQDYFFVDDAEFGEMVKKDKFLECAKVFNHLYGTTKSPVIEKLKNGINVIFDIDWQGAEQIKKKKIEYRLITFFILPPSKKVLFDRLLNRDMKDKLIVDKRMKEFTKDVLHWKNYDYVVINDDLNNCFNEIYKLIDSEINNFSNDYKKELIEKHINQLIS